MGRYAAQVLSCSESDRKELERIVRSHSEPKRLVDRARIILACLTNAKQSVVAVKLGTRPNTVNKWRDRFIAHGLGGLDDAPRSGKPAQYGAQHRDKLLKTLETPPPKGQAAWDGRALAKAVGGTASTAWRILRKDGVQLSRLRSWCVSTDPEFAAKSADIIGLYLNPPQRAIVFSIDEKPSIQALSRKTGYVETSSGKLVRGLQSTYKRNGTLNLFAALNVATGEVKSKTTAAKKRPDFQAFMHEVVKDIPLTQEIHVIVDNYSTHKKNDDWLKAHPNVTFHFTPTSASWLNMVEIWFGILTRKALKGASFNSKHDLAKAIQDFCDEYHKTAKPFVWRKREVKGSQLKNTIANLRN
ncbi:MAG: IS630 family transposase [Pseudomonadota bacterium]